MPEYRVRLGAQRPPEPGQGDHDREQQRLDDICLAQGLPVGAGLGWAVPAVGLGWAVQPACNTSATDQPMCGARALSQTVTPCRKTADSASSSAAIPRHWEPWPPNTNAIMPAPVVVLVVLAVVTGLSAPPTGLPVPVAAAALVPAATVRRPRSRSSRPVPTTTARCVSAARVVASDHPRSVMSVSWLAATNSSSLRAWARRPSSPDPEISHGTVVARSGLAFGRGSGAGACSRIRCALVPEIPNDDTAARRGRPVRGHARALFSKVTLPADQST